MEKEIKSTKSPEGASNYFSNLNYVLLVLGIIFIASGYLLMIGGGSVDPNKFNPEIFDKQRITYAPVTSLIGFAIVIFAIMWRPRQESQD